MIIINDIEHTGPAPVTLKIPVIKTGPLDRWLIKNKYRKPERLFIIRSQSLNSIARIGKIMKAIDIPDGYLKDNDHLAEKVHGIVEKHQREIATIITIAIENRPKEPSRATIDFLIENLSSHDLQAALNVVIHQMNLTSYMQAIAVLKGLQIFSIEPN